MTILPLLSVVSKDHEPVSARSFPANFDQLEAISLFVEEEAVAAGFDEKKVYSIQLAVDEACSNIIEHAYEGMEQGDIHLAFRSYSKGIEIKLVDDGKHFSPDDIPEPEVGVSLIEFGPRGAGIYLMRKMMDEVSYRFLKPKGTELTMIMYKK